MFLKDMRVSYLLDFYGDLLDEHTASVMRAYYNDDLSLAEIALDIGISRQGIRHLIKKGADALEFYDSRLKLSEKHEDILDACDKLKEIADGLYRDGKSDTASQMSEIIEILSKGN